MSPSRQPYPMLRMWRMVAATALLAAACASAADRPPLTLDGIVNRIVAQEQAEVDALEKYSPVVEVYSQNFRVARRPPMMLVKDSDFLARAVLSHGVELESLAAGQMPRPARVSTPMHGISESLLYPDRTGFDRRHYRFDYVRREFLGDIRCLVFDVTPLRDDGRGRFLGRVWVEDQDLHIVRFDGIETGASRRTGLRFDSWRVNAGPNLWLPAYIYSEGGSAAPQDALAREPAFKAQTRLWGYELTERRAAPRRAVSDAALLGRLEEFGLLAPAGEVDADLENLLSTLNRTSEDAFPSPVHCRVLTVSSFEAFSLGNTIVVSRGLLDAVPDRATLAVILAHELGYVLTADPSPAQFAAFERALSGRQAPLSHFGFAYNTEQIASANRRAEELLAASPYLGDNATQLFFQTLKHQAGNMPALVSPALLAMSPAQSPLELASAAASVPPGAGALPIQLDPWSDRLTPADTDSVAPGIPNAATQPFELAPAAPHLVRLASAPPSSGLAVPLDAPR